jgi:hypothetical protein
MANTKIWDLPFVSSPSGSERIPVATGSSPGNNGYLDLNALGAANKQLTMQVSSHGGQTINFNGTLQTLNTCWNEIDFNYGNLWDDSNKKFTAPVSGIWLVTCKVQLDRVTGTGNGEVHLNMNLFANGGSGWLVSDVAGNATLGDRWFLNAVGLIQCNAGESIYSLMLINGFNGTGVVSNAKWGMTLIHRI